MSESWVTRRCDRCNGWAVIHGSKIYVVHCFATRADAQAWCDEENQGALCHCGANASDRGNGCDDICDRCLNLWFDAGQPEICPCTHTETCAYCDAIIPEINHLSPVPDVADDFAWETESSRHNPDCEWITTRAHRVFAS